MIRYKVVKNRDAETNNPIILSKGQIVKPLEQSNPTGDWANWVLCESEDNKGWIPKQIIEIDGELGRITEDYNAKEFDLSVGDIILTSKELNGWIWGYKEGCEGVYAWAPLNHIEIIDRD